MRGREDAEGFQVSAVAERLAPYGAAEVFPIPDELPEEGADPELVERAATLLSVMPKDQLRLTIERLLSPDDLERGRRAVDALIDAALAVEDETGHLRRAS